MRKLLNKTYNTTDWKDELEMKNLLKRGFYKAETSITGDTVYLETDSVVDVSGVLYKLITNDEPIVNDLPTLTTTTLGMNAVEFGNGIFVAVGASGKIVTSTDGITWTARTSPTVNTLRDITYTGSKFYACGNNVVIASVNGTTGWATVSTGLYTVDFYGIAYGDGKVITTNDNNGQYLYSPNGGTTWETRNAYTTTTTYSICYTGTYWITVGLLGNVWRSADGWQSWSDRNAVTSGTYRKVVSIGDDVIAIGHDGLIGNSSNSALTWSTTSGGPASTDFYGAYATSLPDDNFLIVGENGWISTKSEAISAGIGDLAGKTSLGATDNFVDIAYGNGIYVIISTGLTALSTDVFINKYIFLSFDGTSINSYTNGDDFSWRGEANGYYKDGTNERLIGLWADKEVLPIKTIEGKQ